MQHKNGLFPATGMPDPDWWQALWPDPEGTLIKTGLEPGMRAVDLCCGDGLFTAPMSKLLQGQVFAIDLDPTMLETAKVTVHAAGAPACHWIEGDARDMALVIPEKVDAVFIANTFHGVPEQTEMAVSAREVLKPGGLFIIVNWHALPREETRVLGQPRGPRTDMRMTPDEVAHAVAPSGLKLSEIVDLPPYHYGAVFRNPM